MEIKSNFSSIEQITGQYLSQQTKAKTGKAESKTDFREILKQKSDMASMEGLKFSKHADARLNDRNIHLTQEQMQRLEEGTKKANEKGIKESLMIMDNMAFIINIKNQVVVTAMDSSENTENIFTNIDGAVIV